MAGRRFPPASLRRKHRPPATEKPGAVLWWLWETLKVLILGLVIALLVGLSIRSILGHLLAWTRIRY